MAACAATLSSIDNTHSFIQAEETLLGMGNAMLGRVRQAKMETTMEKATTLGKAVPLRRPRTVELAGSSAVQSAVQRPGSKVAGAPGQPGSMRRASDWLERRMSESCECKTFYM